MNPTVPFDAVAQAYDQQFTRSATGRLQRERVHRFIETMPLLKKPARVLELNCGTGEDALWLARKGHQVTATDNSAGMLDAAREKFRNADPLHGSVRFLHYDLNGPLAAGWQSSFDLIFSNFGGLNCLDASSIQRLSGKLVQYLRPGGKLVLVIMGRRCLSEQLYFLSKGHPQKAFRRKSKQPVTVHLADGHEQLTWYYRPGELDHLLNPHFRRSHLEPVGFFLPPSYLDHRVARHPRLLRLLKRLEDSLQGWSLLADRADHYLAEFTSLRQDNPVKTA